MYKKSYKQHMQYSVITVNILTVNSEPTVLTQTEL